MSEQIIKAAMLYVTDREAFDTTYKDTLHTDYLDMLFLESNTRCELSESLAMEIAGYEPLAEKQDYDGFKCLASREGPGEAKVSVATLIPNPNYNPNRKKSKDMKLSRALGAVTINDPSPTIFKKYCKDAPNFIFPFYINGHLIAIFEVKWETFKSKYKQEIQKIRSIGKGRRNFSINTGDWINDCSVLYCTTTQEPLIGYLPKAIQKKLIPVPV